MFVSKSGMQPYHLDTSANKDLYDNHDKNIFMFINKL